MANIHTLIIALSPIIIKKRLFYQLKYLLLYLFIYIFTRDLHVFTRLCAYRTNGNFLFVHFEKCVIKSLNFEDFILQNVFFLYIFCSYFVYILNSVVQEKVIYS